MRKYVMLIDGEIYMALFKNDADFIYFKWENEACGSVVQYVEDYEVTYEDILEDDDFEYDYRLEKVAEIVMPKEHFHKVSEIEEGLYNLGII